MPATLRKHRFTVQDYHRMGEAGILHEDSRVELIEGEIVQMSPIGNWHTSHVKRINDLLTFMLHGEAVVGIQDPIRLPGDNEPQPDVSVLRYRADYYAACMPAPDDILLLIEVADSTFATDSETKIPLYARSGIVEVWIVDADANAIHVYRSPCETGYRVIETLTAGQTVTCEAMPLLSVAVSDIL